MQLRRYRIEAGLAGFIALLLLGLWVGPQLLTWERHRETLAAIASARLGRPVTLDGAITLRLLPQPQVEAADVVVGPGADGVAVTARALRLRLALGPLLRGRLEPRELALLGSEIRLPWPPAPLGPLDWLGEFDAQLQDSRLVLGGLVLEALDGRLGIAADALQAEGSMSWHGMALRFQARLGRPGADGKAPLTLSLSGAGASLAVQGALAPGGMFDGQLELSGQDLAQLLPAPPGAFRATGQMHAVADQLEARALTLELGGLPARGSAALRLLPEPRLELALEAARLELEPWLAALRVPRAGRLPVGLSLALENTRLAGVPLRQLRGSFLAGADRLTLSDVSALLPGEALVELSGASALQRLELAVRLRAPALRETLLALGLPLAGTEPAALRNSEARFRLTLDNGDVAVSALVASLDGARLTGEGQWRPAREGGRPSLALVLAAERLELDPLLPQPLEWALLSGPGPGFDVNLRLAAEALRWRGQLAQRLVLEAGLENGRLALRRGALRLGELDLALSGVAQLGPQPRLAELLLEASGPSALVLAPQLPEGLALAQPLSLRLAGGGVLEALALRGEAELGELRLEGQGVVDAPGRRGQGSLTARHPNAVRLLGAPLGWLGPGSFSAVAGLVVAPRLLTAEHFSLVAGGLRGRGAVALALEGARPRLTGQVVAASLPLPGLGEAWGLESFPAWDAELALRALRVALGVGPVLEQVSGRLQAEAGLLRLGGVEARLAGGRLTGELRLEAGAEIRLAVAGKLLDATLTGPLLDMPFDLEAGRLDAEVQLAGAGLASLAGEVSLAVRDGVLRGVDLAALGRAAGLADIRLAEAGMRQALAGGATGFERLEAQASMEAGRVRLGALRLVGEGVDAATEGEVDLPRGLLEVRLLARPGSAGMAEAPELRLRLTGPLQAPRRVPELAEFLRGRGGR